MQVVGKVVSILLIVIGVLGLVFNGILQEEFVNKKEVVGYTQNVKEAVLAQGITLDMEKQGTVDELYNDLQTAWNTRMKQVNAELSKSLSEEEVKNKTQEGTMSVEGLDINHKEFQTLNVIFKHSFTGKEDVRNYLFNSKEDNITKKRLIKYFPYVSIVSGLILGYISIAYLSPWTEEDEMYAEYEEEYQRKAKRYRELED